MTSKKTSLLASIALVAGIAVSLSSTTIATARSYVHANKAGAACAKAGATAKSSAGVLKCVKNGKKLTWQMQKAAKPTPAKTTPAAAAGLPAQSAYDITVNAHQWSYNFSYLVDGKAKSLTPAESSVLYLPEGKLVHFNLTSADTTHGFWVPGLLINASMDPGASGHLDFTGDKLGSFPGRCNVSSCGRGHAGMAFTVKVVSEADFLSYLAGLK